MDYSLQVLRTVYEIVKEDPDPLTYPCKPRELILRLHEDWALIYEQLLLLEQKYFIQLKQLDTLVVLITKSGIEKLNEEVNAQPLQ